MFAREPAVIIGALEGLALAVLGLIIIVTEMEPAVAGAVTAIVGASVAVLSSLFVRTRVTPVA